MAVVGIDLGSQNTKAVILEGDEILGGASLRPGNRRRPRPGWRCRKRCGRRASTRGPEGRGGDRHPRCARHRGCEHRGPEATFGGQLHRHGSLLPFSPGADGPVCRRR